MYNDERTNSKEEVQDERSYNKGSNKRNSGKSKGRGRNNRRRGRGNNPNGAGRNSDATTVARGVYADAASGRNDLSWYTKNPDLIAVASRLAMPYRPGNKVNFGPLTTVDGVTYDASVTVPGVMAIEFVPTVGFSDSTMSPISTCATRMWTQIRSKFSSDLNVDPPDIFMYVYGLANIHAYLEFMKRIFRTLNTYSPDNYDYPRNVFRAQFPMMGSNEADTLFAQFLANKNQFLITINEMVNAVNVFRIPDKYPIIHRLKWMNQHVYMDENRPNAQTYLFRQTCYYCVDDTGDTGTALNVVNLAGTVSYTDVIELGWTLITAMTNWEDAYTINGYIARAWEGAPAVLSALLTEYEVLTPMYVEEVLVQIENSTICPVNTQDGVHPIGGITQNPADGTVYHKPNGAYNYESPYGLMNLHGSTNEAAVIIASRLASMTGPAVENDSTKRYVISGSEIVKDVRLVFGGAGTSVEDINLGATELQLVTNGSSNGATTISKFNKIRTLFLLQYWHHHPLIYMNLNYNTSFAADSDAYKWRRDKGVIPLCDLDYITSYDARWLEDLHRVTFYSLFNCFNRDEVIKRGGTD